MYVYTSTLKPLVKGLHQERKLDLVLLGWSTSSQELSASDVMLLLDTTASVRQDTSSANPAGKAADAFSAAEVKDILLHGNTQPDCNNVIAVSAGIQMRPGQLGGAGSPHAGAAGGA